MPLKRRFFIWKHNSMLQGNTLKLVEHTATNVTKGFSFLVEKNCSQPLVWQHVLNIRSFFSDVHVKNVILDWVDDVCSFASFQSPQNLDWKRRLNSFLGEWESPPCWKRIRVSDDLIYDNHFMHTVAWCSGNKLYEIMTYEWCQRSIHWGNKFDISWS